MPPLVVMLAGPNGAGKSTYYQAYLSHLALPFLNADNLANKTGLDAYTSAEQIARIREIMRVQKQSFIVETVLSGTVGAKINFLKKAVKQGFQVRFIFIGIADAALSQERVASRVKAGGHNVPADKIQQCYPRTLENLKLGIEQLPDVWIYDNSSYENPYHLLAQYKDNKQVYQSTRSTPDWAQPFV